MTADGRLAEQCHRLQQWQAENEGAGSVWIVTIIEGVASPFTFRNQASFVPERSLSGTAPIRK